MTAVVKFGAVVDQPFEAGMGQSAVTAMVGCNPSGGCGRLSAKTAVLFADITYKYGFYNPC
jgi:hypothetical protein